MKILVAVDQNPYSAKTADVVASWQEIPGPTSPFWAYCLGDLLLEKVFPKAKVSKLIKGSEYSVLILR